jgi:hypothetical protein
MAIRPSTITRTQPWGDAWNITWTVDTGDQGSSIEMPGANDRTVMVTGTFSTTTVVLQGSNDNVNWFTLNSPQGTALSFTAPGLLAVQEHCRYVRPSASAGTGTGLVVTLFVKGQLQ